MSQEKFKENRAVKFEAYFQIIFVPVNKIKNIFPFSLKGSDSMDAESDPAVSDVVLLRMEDL